MHITRRMKRIESDDALHVLNRFRSATIVIKGGYIAPFREIRIELERALPLGQTLGAPILPVQNFRQSHMRLGQVAAERDRLLGKGKGVIERGPVLKFAGKG